MEEIFGKREYIEITGISEELQRDYKKIRILIEKRGHNYQKLRLSEATSSEMGTVVLSIKVGSKTSQLIPLRKIFRTETISVLLIN